MMKLKTALGIQDDAEHIRTIKEELRDVKQRLDQIDMAMSTIENASEELIAADSQEGRDMGSEINHLVHMALGGFEDTMRAVKKMESQIRKA